MEYYNNPLREEYGNAFYQSMADFISEGISPMKAINKSLVTTAKAFQNFPALKEPIKWISNKSGLFWHDKQISDKPDVVKEGLGFSVAECNALAKFLKESNLGRFSCITFYNVDDYRTDTFLVYTDCYDSVGDWYILATLMCIASDAYEHNTRVIGVEAF